MINRYRKNPNGSYNITLESKEMSREQILESEKIRQEYENSLSLLSKSLDEKRLEELVSLAQKNTGAVKVNG